MPGKRTVRRARSALAVVAEDQVDLGVDRDVRGHAQPVLGRGLPDRSEEAS